MNKSPLLDYSDCLLSQCRVLKSKHTAPVRVLIACIRHWVMGDEQPSSSSAFSTNACYLLIFSLNLSNPSALKEDADTTCTAAGSNESGLLVNLINKITDPLIYRPFG